MTDAFLKEARREHRDAIRQTQVFCEAAEENMIYLHYLTPEEKLEKDQMENYLLYIARRFTQLAKLNYARLETDHQSRMALWEQEHKLGDQNTTGSVS